MASNIGKSNENPELTAEWTVHAQLTITRPSDNAPNPLKAGSTSYNETVGQQKSKKPVCYVYKWSSDDIKNGNRSSQQSSSKSTSGGGRDGIGRFDSGNVMFKTESDDNVGTH